MDKVGQTRQRWSNLGERIKNFIIICICITYYVIRSKGKLKIKKFIILSKIIFKLKISNLLKK